MNKLDAKSSKRSLHKQRAPHKVGNLLRDTQGMKFVRKTQWTNNFQIFHFLISMGFPPSVHYLIQEVLFLFSLAQENFFCSAHTKSHYDVKVFEKQLNNTKKKIILAVPQNRKFFFWMLTTHLEYSRMRAKTIKNCGF